MKNIIIPTKYYKGNNPLIFFGGPVRGIPVPDWRNYATEFVRKIDETIAIGFPTPTKKGEDEFDVGINSLSSNTNKKDPIEYIKPELREFVFEGHDEQFLNYRSWKEYTEEVAARKGVLLFWIPQEQKNEDKYTEFGINTAYEIEYWTNEIRKTAKISHPNIHMSVGIEGQFKLWNDEDYREIFKNTKIQIEKSLEHTLLDAIKKCQTYKR